MTTTVQAGSATEIYRRAFHSLEASLPGANRPAIARLRSSALASFEQAGFPGPRNEDWKFTSVTPITRTAFQLTTSDNLPIPNATLPAGVIVCSLAEALQRHPDLVEPHLGRIAGYQHQAFTALNTAFWREGAFLYVPAGVVVEQPLLLSAVAEASTQQPTLWYRRVLIVLGRASQARVVESFTGSEALYMTNAVTEVVLDEGANLDHYRVQEESLQAYHFSCLQVEQARDSRFSTHYVGLGGSLVRNEVRVRFQGSNAEATVNGVYLATGTQHHDTHTVIDHAVPHCSSHELYKGILDDRAKGVFNGKIFVRKDAQKTDAKQTNQTLLLSDEATIDTKPQLEIFADDVKCTHGATVGQLDERQLFYLRSRGIGLAQARALLTFAFANDIIGRIQVESLRDRLERALLASSHLPPLAESEEL
jgi:Fe-S cluster assembly protein SufD